MKAPTGLHNRAPGLCLLSLHFSYPFSLNIRPSSFGRTDGKPLSFPETFSDKKTKGKWRIERKLIKNT